MAELKGYLVQEADDGSVMISQEVIASIAAIAIREVDGVYGLTAGTTLDIGNILGKKNFRKGIDVKFNDDGMTISCNLVIKMGSSVMTVAKAVQEAIAEEVTNMAGTRPACVNVNVSGIAVPKTPKA